MFLNGFVLLLVALFPFPTRTVGRFISSGGEGTAVAFYAAFTGFINLAMLLLTAYLYRHKSLLVTETSAEPLAALLRHEMIGVASYAALAAMGVPFPRLALTGTFLMWVFWALVVAASDEPAARKGSTSGHQLR